MFLAAFLKAEIGNIIRMLGLPALPDAIKELPCDYVVTAAVTALLNEFLVLIIPLGIIKIYFFLALEKTWIPFSKHFIAKNACS